MKHESFALADTIDLIEEILAGGGEFRMYPTGSSMLPLIVEKRDSVVLSRKTGCPAARYDIAFYRRHDGQFVLHRVMKIDPNGNYTMCGDHQTFLETGISPDQIIGCVSVLYRKEKKVPVTSFFYRVYVRIWSWMFFRRTVFRLKNGCRKIWGIFRKK